MVETHPPIPPPATFGSAAAEGLTGADATIHGGDGGVFELILIGALLAPGTWPAIFVRQGEGFRPTGCFDRPGDSTQRAPGRL